MERKKILLVGGSINQTKLVHAVAQHLEAQYDCYFSPAYCDPPLDWLRRIGTLGFTVLGDRIRKSSEAYILENNLKLDYGGKLHDYDFVVITSDLIIQKNIRRKPIIMIQEGMTDAEDIRYWLVKLLKLPRWLAGTSTNGLSDAYRYFCVASEGYRDHFIMKGCRPEKVVVTGIPNFDNVEAYKENNFPYKDYVLVATSNARETLKLDDRGKFLRWTLEIAGDRPLIFKLHPNENVERATREIKAVAPQALVFSEGNTDHMIANCDALITQYSTCIYVGLAMGKECHSYFDMDELMRLTPLQNDGLSGWNIAQLVRRSIEGSAYVPPKAPRRRAPKRRTIGEMA
jgi:hypothetical protein